MTRAGFCRSLWLTGQGGLLLRWVRGVLLGLCLVNAGGEIGKRSLVVRVVLSRPAAAVAVVSEAIEARNGVELEHTNAISVV